MDSLIAEAEPSFSLNIVAQPRPTTLRTHDKKRNTFENKRVKTKEDKALKKLQKKGLSENESKKQLHDSAVIRNRAKNHVDRTKLNKKYGQGRTENVSDVTHDSHHIDRNDQESAYKKDYESFSGANGSDGQRDMNESKNDDNENVVENADDSGGSDSDDGDDEHISGIDNLESEKVNNSLPNLPQDFEERAKYLAEFHARPMEMDRRAGRVTKKVGKGKESQHLFEQARTWQDFSSKLHPRLVNAVQEKLGLERPTNIQTKALATFFGGALNTLSSQRPNLLIHSETGSGKTLAYLLPIVQSLAVDSKTGSLRTTDSRSQAGTRCIILCPTRELATQTLLVAERLCSQTFHFIVPGCLFGDEKRKSEKARIRKGLTILVATPGRLLDHLTRTESLLMALKGKLEWLVADEADRLLDMGLGEQVKQIVQRIRANQPGSGKDGITWRSVLVSATVTTSVETLAKDALLGEDPTWMWVKGGSAKNSSTDEFDSTNQVPPSNSEEFADSTPRQLMQLHMMVSAKLKLSALVAFLVQRVQKKERTVIFFSTCAAVDYYHALFQYIQPIMGGGATAGSLKNAIDDGVKTSGMFRRLCTIHKLHGSIPRGERQMVLRKFSNEPNSKKELTEKDLNSSSKRAAILLATDVASRGLNLPAVDWIVQYDPPSEVSDYVHRVGRVARAGRAGHSLLMLLPSEQAFLQVLKNRGIKHMTGLSLASTLNAAAGICEDVTNGGVHRSGGILGKSIQDSSSHGAVGSRLGEAFSSEVQRRLEDCVREDETKRKASEKELTKNRKNPNQQKGARHAPMKGDVSSTPGLVELARAAFLSHMRAYPTREKEVRHIFSAKALHVGHVARSFALREPPKKVSRTKPTSDGASEDPDEISRKRKAEARMEFAPFEDADEQHQGRNGQKKQKRGGSGSKNTAVRNSRELLLENATKLQQNGLDAM